MAGSGLALKLLQWFIRGVQFCCSALVLSIYCYFLATLANHDLSISDHLRAVTGISGLATLYTIAGLALLCCLAGLAFTSALAMFLDGCFAAAFIYVAWANRNGASSCNGYLDTPYGRGRDRATTEGSDGFTHLPSYRSACRMQTACFAVSIVAIFFFLFSIGVELLLVRHRRKERRFGPGPNNNYTSGSGRRKPGFFSFRRRRNEKHALDAGDNTLPQHATPAQVRNSYNTEATAVGHPDNAPAATHAKYGESGYAHDPAVANTNNVNAPSVPNAYGYQDTTGAANPYHGGYGQQAGVQNATPGYSHGDGVYDRR